jgi:hypothetical protein
MLNARRVILASLIASALRIVFPTPAHAAGPWEAQVVSAATKQPLGDVVVVAFWTRNVRTRGEPTSDYRFSEETFTDSDGRFTFVSRSFFSFHPSVVFRGPFFVFFKPGYGRARWPGREVSERRPEQEAPGPPAYAELLERDGIVLEMPALRSIEERRDYLKEARGASRIVPREQTPLLNSAIAEEQQAITLK